MRVDNVMQGSGWRNSIINSSLKDTKETNPHWWSVTAILNENVSLRAAPVYRKAIEGAPGSTACWNSFGHK